MAYKKKVRPDNPAHHLLAVRLLTPEEAGTVLGIAPQTLAHWRARGCGPAYVLLSARCVRYSDAVLRDWLAARTQSSTAENPA